MRAREFWFLGPDKMCVGGIENANDESIIHTEYAVRSNPNKNVDDLVIIDSSGEEECCRETVIAVLPSVDVVPISSQTQFDEEKKMMRTIT